MRNCAPILNGVLRMRGAVKWKSADVSCIGRCDAAPAIAVNDHIFTDVTADHAEAVVRAALRGDELHDGHPEQARVALRVRSVCRCGKYGALRAEIARKDWGACWRC